VSDKAARIEALEWAERVAVSYKRNAMNVVKLELYDGYAVTLRAMLTELRATPSATEGAVYTADQMRQYAWDTYMAIGSAMEFHELPLPKAPKSEEGR
jgi:hypothetical protein